jgi:hypothetical protein
MFATGWTFRLDGESMYFRILILVSCALSYQLAANPQVDSGFSRTNDVKLAVDQLKSVRKPGFNKTRALVHLLCGRFARVAYCTYRKRDTTAFATIMVLICGAYGYYDERQKLQLKPQKQSLKLLFRDYLCSFGQGVLEREFLFCRPAESYMDIVTASLTNPKGCLLAILKGQDLDQARAQGTVEKGIDEYWPLGAALAITGAQIVSSEYEDYGIGFGRILCRFLHSSKNA